MNRNSGIINQYRLTHYKTTFRAPLSDSAYEALQLLLVGQFDSITMNLDMIGLDEEAN